MYVCMPQVTHTWWQLVTHSGILWWICDILTGSSSIRDWVMNLPGDPSSSDTVQLRHFSSAVRGFGLIQLWCMGFVCIEFTRVVWGMWFGDLKDLSLLGSWIFGFYRCRTEVLGFEALGWYVDCGQAGRLKSILPILNAQVFMEELLNCGQPTQIFICEL